MPHIAPSALSILVNLALNMPDARHDPCAAPVLVGGWEGEADLTVLHTFSAEPSTPFAGMRPRTEGATGQTRGRTPCGDGHGRAGWYSDR